MCMDEVEICRMRSSVWIQLRPLSLPNVRHDPTVNPDEEWIIGGNRAAQVARESLVAPTSAHRWPGFSLSFQGNSKKFLRTSRGVKLIL